MAEKDRVRGRASSLGNLLVLLPFPALAVAALFPRSEPEIGGVPFFYWYQLLWIPLSSVCMAIAYWLRGAR